MRVNFVSTYKIRCGVATYSEFLTEELKKITKLRILPIKKPAPLSPIYWKWLAMNARTKTDIIHVQFNYELFGKSSFWTYFNSLLFFYTIFFLNTFKKIPVILTFHEIFPAGRKLVRSTDKIYKRADAFIVHTEEAKKALEARGYKNIYVVPHGVYNKPVFLPQEECRKKLGLPNKKILTIFGFVNPFKNYEFAFEVLKNLPKDYFLLIAGGCRIKEDEEYFNKVTALFKKFPENSKILGFVKDEDQDIVFNATDIFLFPYKRTTQSGVMSRVFAYKKPCVAAPLTAFKEINAKYPCLEIAKDQNDWVGKIKKITTDNKYRENLITHIDQYYQENNWTNIAKVHESIYEKIQNQN